MLVLNSLIEHNSNELPWRCTPGVDLIRLEADGDGFIDIARLEEILKEHNQGDAGQQPIQWVSISGASNVLGALNDLEAISVGHPQVWRKTAGGCRPIDRPPLHSDADERN